MTTDWLFPKDEISTMEIKPKYNNLKSAIWTQRKAYLIQLYLELFVFVTYRGTYIDAFAGPQELTDAWAAKLVWEKNPGKKRKRLDRFEFFEAKKESASALVEMIGRTEADGRKAYVRKGDSNVAIPEMLAKRPITSPAFCLLDQRSMECNWALVREVALHKKEGHKIELFYFLMAGWKNRSLKNLTRDPDGDMERWWGRKDFQQLLEADNTKLAEIFCNRFKEEFSYAHVTPFPIYSNPSGCDGGRLQYWMIHASDHDEAPKFMIRAFNKLASGYDPNSKQNDFGWSEDELKAALSGVDGWDSTVDVE